MLAGGRERRCRADRRAADRGVRQGQGRPAPEGRHGDDRPSEWHLSRPVVTIKDTRRSGRFAGVLYRRFIAGGNCSSRACSVLGAGGVLPGGIDGLDNPQALLDSFVNQYGGTSTLGYTQLDSNGNTTIIPIVNGNSP